MMNSQFEREAMFENLTRTYLTTGDFEKERPQRHLFRLLSGGPHCKSCDAPFQGAGSLVVKLAYEKKPSDLGDAANTTARLASSARTGEILVSDAAPSASGLGFYQAERRSLELKGKSQAVSVLVLNNLS
jgi:hypothetical protein